MQQSSSTIMNMIQSAIPRQFCSSQIIFVRSDDLDIGYFSEKYQPDIVVMNVGAHYHNLTVFEADAIKMFEKIDGVKLAQSEQNLKDIKFVWKTSNPGHLDCDFSPNATNSYSPPAADQDRFDWRFFVQYDTLMDSMTAAHNMDVIDMTPLYYRPDGHPGKSAWGWHKTGGDCLHYCLPGPLDIFATLLMQYLMDE